MQEIKKALEGYYNFCMDEFDGYVSEEAIDMFMEKEYEEERVAKRQSELFKAHPFINKLANERLVVGAWVGTWSKGNLSIEDGLADLVCILNETGSNKGCTIFSPPHNNNTTSKTKCIACGKEEWEH